MMRKLKTGMQTVILIVILFLLVSPMLSTYAKTLFNDKNEENIITIEERYNCGDLVLSAGVSQVLYIGETPLERLIAAKEEREKQNPYKLTLLEESKKEQIPLTTLTVEGRELVSREKKETIMVAEENPIVEPEIVEEVVVNESYLGQYRLTAYCKCEKCCGKWSKYNSTASGTVPEAGRTVACNSLAFGTKIIINDHTYIVEDRGNMSNDIIDIFFNSHEEALQFGLQYADVYIVNE